MVGGGKVGSEQDGWALKSSLQNGSDGDTGTGTEGSRGRAMHLHADAPRQQLHPDRHPPFALPGLVRANTPTPLCPPLGTKACWPICRALAYLGSICMRTRTLGCMRAHILACLTLAYLHVSHLHTCMHTLTLHQHQPHTLTAPLTLPHSFTLPGQPNGGREAWPGPPRGLP